VHIGVITVRGRRN